MTRGKEFHLQAGSLRHPLVVQNRIDSRSETGSATHTWEDKPGIIWGSVRGLRSTEKVNAEKVTSLATHRIQIRTIAALKPSQRIRYGTRFFNIESLLDIDEIKKTQVLAAIEVAE